MSPARMAQVESAMRTVLAFNQACNRHDVAAMMQLLTDDCVFEHFSPPPDGTRYTGKASIRQFWHDFFRAAPQAQIEAEEVSGLGLRCVMRWKYRWVDAAGAPAYVRGVDLIQVRNGLICEMLSYVKG